VAALMHLIVSIVVVLYVLIMLLIHRIQGARLMMNS
jgi:hypothetical protein